MNAERDYVSVIIKVHEYFKKTSEEIGSYEKRIIEILMDKQMSLTELSYAMGYKGITAKLSKTIDKLIADKKIITILGEDKKPKLTVKSE